jgi:hypothetical protein
MYSRTIWDARVRLLLIIKEIWYVDCRLLPKTEIAKAKLKISRQYPLYCIPTEKGG